MLFWAVDNPPPANYLLISGDRDFSNALHQLSMRRYNILLAQPPNVSQALTAAAKTVWYWTDILVGGPPLSLSSHAIENGSSSEASRNSPVEVRKPADSSSSSSNLAYHKVYVNGKADSPFKGKQQTLLNSPHKFNDSHKLEPKQFTALEYMRAAKPSTMEPYPTNDVSNNFNDSQYPPHFPTPQNLAASRPYQQSGNFTYPNSSSQIVKFHAQSTWNNAPVFVKQSRKPRAISADPDISRRSIATLSYPEEANMTPCYQENMQHRDVSLNTTGPLAILSALRILRDEKMPPTEANVTDCIRYGEFNILDFDCRNALEFAIQHHVLDILKLGGIVFYVGKGESLWKCINVLDSQVRHPKAVCDAVLRFLSSTDGHASMMSSRCMYEAASILKRTCLKTHALGEILQILNAAIHQKKWILPNSSGWQPLSLLLPAIIASDTNAEPSCS